MDFIQCTQAGLRHLGLLRVCLVFLKGKELILLRHFGIFLFHHLYLLSNSFFFLSFCLYSLVNLLYFWIYSRLSGNLRTSEEGADTIIWLALQPKEKLASGAFYFDRAEAPKHLMFSATGGSHVVIDSVVDSLRSLSALSS